MTNQSNGYNDDDNDKGNNDNDEGDTGINGNNDNILSTKSGQTSCMVVLTGQYINILSRNYKIGTFQVVSPPDLILLAV